MRVNNGSNDHATNFHFPSALHTFYKLLAQCFVFCATTSVLIDSLSSHCVVFYNKALKNSLCSVGELFMNKAQHLAAVEPNIYTYIGWTEK